MISRRTMMNDFVTGFSGIDVELEKCKGSLIRDIHVDGRTVQNNTENIGIGSPQEVMSSWVQICRFSHMDLRKDYKNEDGTWDFSKASLRFNCFIKLPEMAKKKRFYFNYGVVDIGNSLIAEITGEVDLGNNLYKSNMVAMNNPRSNFHRKIYVVLYAIFTDKNGVERTANGMRLEYSVNDAAKIMLNDPNSSDEDKEYAKGILGL